MWDGERRGRGRAPEYEHACVCVSNSDSSRRASVPASVIIFAYAYAAPSCPAPGRLRITSAKEKEIELEATLVHTFYFFPFCALLTRARAGWAGLAQTRSLPRLGPHRRQPTTSLRPPPPLAHTLNPQTTLAGTATLRHFHTHPLVHSSTLFCFSHSIFNDSFMHSYSYAYAHANTI
jgi:hypothetical protein